MDMSQGALFETSSLATPVIGSSMGISVPLAELRLLSKTQVDCKSRLVGSITTGMFADKFSIPHDLAEKASAQQEYIRQQDVSGRIRYMYEPSSESNHGYPSGFADNGVYSPAPGGLQRGPFTISRMR